MMRPSELEQRLDILANCDPDYVVDVLELTSEELINAFPSRAEYHIRKEFGVEDE